MDADHPKNRGLIPRRFTVLRKVDAAGRVVKTRAVVGGEAHTTNNRMELLAAIRGLQALKRAELPVVVVSDSAYVRNGISKWITGWKANGWLTSARKPVLNADMWRELDAVASSQRVDWRWTKGHAGDLRNEEVDQLARLEAEAQAALAEAA